MTAELTAAVLLPPTSVMVTTVLERADRFVGVRTADAERAAVGRNASLRDGARGRGRSVAPVDRGCEIRRGFRWDRSR